MNFQLVLDKDLVLAETPVWDERISKLYYTDLFEGDIYQYDPSTKQEKMWKTNALIGSAVLTDDENKILCTTSDGIFVLDLITEERTHIAHPEKGNDVNRYNDTRVDPVGRIYASSMAKVYGSDAYTPDMMGKFYMIDTDGSVKVIEEAINQYNAIVWNKDATKMFVCDTYNETLVCYDYDINKGVIGEAKVVISFTEQGMPDGMSIDTEDNLYICHWSGKISVWNKDYELIETVQTPVEYCCCTGFGGADMKDLYLATSKYCYDAEQLEKNKGAGGIFMARSDIKGTRDHYYKINK